ncbi:MAG: dihydroorotase [Aquirufa sp.]
MRILIKSVLILDSQSSFFNQKVDLLIQDGELKEVADDLSSLNVDETLEGSNFQFYPGLVDCRVHHTLPGGEYLEDWNSLATAAKKGGVLDLLLLPTSPILSQTAESIQHIREKSVSFKLNFYPSAPLTLDNQGENFSELLDLANAGAKWFSHGSSTLNNTDLMLKSLQYLLPLDVCVISQPDTKALSLYGQIHEGLQSTLLGLKGIPTLSETLSIKRDLDLLRYVLNNSFGQANKNFSLHFSCISSAESVDLINQAKKEGLPVSCDVAVHHLIFNEDAVSDFSTLKKVYPPFRTEIDRLALWNGLKNQTIDFVVSDHHPVETELKDIEFDHAAFGTVGLETLLVALIQEAKVQGFTNIAEVLTYRPAKFLKMEKSSLSLNSMVKGVIVEETSTYKYQPSNIVGKSKNSTFIDTDFQYRIAALINQSEITIY